jgi:prepilin-type N-terminal cleavage/methylation domain-containing protein
LILEAGSEETGMSRTICKATQLRAASSRRCVIGSERGPSRRARNRDDRGFTLVELLIVMVVTPLIVGALSFGLITIFSLQSGVANRLGDSGDAETVAATYTKDVQGAAFVTTSPTPLMCGSSGTQLLGLQLGSVNKQLGDTISYVEQAQTSNGTTTYSMVRNYCKQSELSTPTSSTYLSYDLAPPCPSAGRCQAAPVAYQGENVFATSGVTSTVGMTMLQFPIVEQNTSSPFQLEASPAQGLATTNEGNQTLNTTSFCGYALAGTGTYASSMCFVGFTTTELQEASPSGGSTCIQTDPGQKGLDMSVDIPGGYVMSFCLTTSDTSLIAVSTPVGGGTCAQQKPACDGGNISNGQGFLGNDNDVNGTPTPFYAGIGCPPAPETPTLQNNVVSSSCINPAIFQTTSGGTDTVTLSNIEVTDPSENPATGYEIISADAETIDPGGYISWTSSLPASKPLPFNLVPNFQSSDLGNACNEVPSNDVDPPANASVGWGIDNGDATVQINGSNYTGGLTGLGTASVKCQSNWQTVPGQNGQPSYLRTGTAMIGISPPTVNGGAEPVTISAQLKGEGYNAVAFGLLTS